MEDAAQESALVHKERGRPRTLGCREMLQREILRLRIADLRSAIADLVGAVPESLEFLNLPRRSLRGARNSTRQGVRLPASEIVHGPPEIRECIA